MMVIEASEFSEKKPSSVVYDVGNNGTAAYNQKSNDASLLESKTGRLLNFLTPFSSHPASRQPTPLNINRFVLLLVYTLYTFLTACVYFGWPSMASMLFKSGAFEWLCDGEPEIGGTENKDKNCKCDAQDAKVQQLFAITLAVHSTMSAVAGLLLDVIGPKLTASLGQCFNFLGWLLLGFSSTDFRAYYPAMVFIGLGADAGFVPVIPLANLFPGSSALVTTVLGAAASASFAVPIVLNTILSSNDSVSVNTLFFCYMGFGPVLCLIVALLLFPWKSFLGEDQYAETFAEKGAMTKEKAGDNFMLAGENDKKGNDEACSKDAEDEVSMQSGQKKFSLTSAQITRGSLADDADSFIVPIDGATPIEEKPPRSNDDVSAEKTHCSGKDENNGEASRGDLRLGTEKEVSVWKQFCSVNFWCICIVYFIVVNIAISYYQQASYRMFNSSVVYALDILLPMSWFPCIILGKCIDVFGIMPVMCVLNFSALISYLLALCKATAAQYLSVIFFCVYISLYTSQIYCFVMAVFPSKHFGKLSGVSIMIGGLCSLLSYPLYDHLTLRYLKSDTIPVCIGMSIAVAAMFIVLAYVWILRRKRTSRVSDSSS